MNLEKFIRDERKRRGLTQSQLAKMANLSVVTISRIERGNEARPKTIRSLLDFFGVELCPEIHD